MTSNKESHWKHTSKECRSHNFCTAKKGRETKKDMEEIIERDFMLNNTPENFGFWPNLIILCD